MHDWCLRKIGNLGRNKCLSIIATSPKGRLIVRKGSELYDIALIIQINSTLTVKVAITSIMYCTKLSGTLAKELSCLILVIHILPYLMIIGLKL